MSGYRIVASHVDDRGKSCPEAAHRNRPPVPMLPRADPRTAAKLDVAAQYSQWSARAWQRGKQGAVPSAHPLVHLQQLRSQGSKQAADKNAIRPFHFEVPEAELIE